MEEGKKQHLLYFTQKQVNLSFTKLKRKDNKMLNLQYVNEKTYYQVNFKYLSENIVQITGDFPIKTKGFNLSRIGSPEVIIGNYSEYKTVYKEIENGAIFSNDGSVYVEPLKVVTFNAGIGGTLDGTIRQEVYNYEDLIIPTPIANADYEFVSWSPEIPLSGDVESNKIFTALFTSTLPEPEPEPTLEERVATLETAVINNL